MINDLENPFSVLKATEFSNEQIRDYWVDFGEGENSIFYLLNPTEYLPKYLLGSKGSGKTHILKYASYPLQKIKANNDFNELIKDQYIGLHYETYSLKISRFKDRGISEDEWHTLFEYYLDLFLIDNLLNTYAEIFDGLSISKSVIERILLSIRDLFINHEDWIEITSLKGLIDFITSLRNNIDSEINNVAYTKKFNLLKIKSNFNPGDLIFGIPEIIENNIEELKNVKIIYIIDEFEKFEDWQKEYINTLIWDKRNPVTFWIGMRTWGCTTLRTKTADQIRAGHEFKLINLDTFIAREEKLYNDFAIKLYTSRLQKYYEKRHKIVRDELHKNFSSKFEIYDEASVITYFSEKGKHKDLKHITRLRDKSTKEYPIKNIDEIIHTLIDGEDNALHQKYIFFRFYYLWNKNKSKPTLNLLALATEVSAEFKLYKAGNSAIFDEIVSKRKKDFIAQLCEENNEVSKNIEHSGIDSFIERSQSNPRNLLMLLMKCIEYSNVKNEKPLEEKGKISLTSQYFALYDTAKWFYETIEIKGEEAKKLYDSLFFLTEILKLYRYCDKPTETSVFCFNVSQANLTTNSLKMLSNLQTYSIIVKDDNGRKEKNSSIQEVRYNLNKILCPLWGLPIKKRGVMDLNDDTANLILDQNFKKFFEDKFKKIKTKFTAPFDGSPQSVGPDLFSQL